MAVVTIEALDYRIGAAEILSGIDLRLEEGEFLALLGPSGCGKSSLLRLIAGFEQPSAGRILLDGVPVAAPDLLVPPEERGIGMVFQSYALWPHLDVAGNVGYALRARRMPAPERAARVEEALERVGLSGMGARPVQHLSGGQRQRVALARCLAMRPRLMLLDEPLANLDTHLREVMVEELRRLHRETGATIVHVTHDQTEAMALADRIAVMERGRFLQVGAPSRLWEQPLVPRVAEFIGRGQLVPVELLETGPVARARLWGSEVTLRAPVGRGPGPAQACLRRTGLRVLDLADRIGFVAEVVDALPQGATTLLTLKPAASPGMTLRVESDRPLPGGMRIRVGVMDGWVLPQG